MALARRGQRFNTAIWPGFVDAMTGLLLVLMFVLTIFMVIQFVLQQTISGQEDELDSLSAEVASLASALGFEQTRTAEMSEQLADAGAEAARQAALINRLTLDLESRSAALTEAENRITGFEAQVAGLLARQQEAQTRIADLEGREAELVSEQEALALALATARSEIDAGAEAARLAAARREALEALVADLRRTSETQQADLIALEAARAADAEALTEAEAARLAEAAAAEALRARLENADAELTAMTLALEEQRREAEETLTLLAAAQAARDDLSTNLAAALLARQTADAELQSLQDALALSDAARAAAQAEAASAAASLATATGEQGDAMARIAALEEALAAAQAAAAELDTRLVAALSVSDTTAEDLAAAREALAAADLSRVELQEQLAAAVLARDGAQSTLADLEARLAEALIAREGLEAQVASLSETATAGDAAAADLQARLAAALAEADSRAAAAEEQANEAARQAALLEVARQALSEEEALSAESQRQVALLNEQIAALRNQVGTLQALLDLANEEDVASQVEIDRLGAQLNTALARAAAEERRRAQLEEAERLRLEEEAARLAAEAQNLERFRSDFFGQMRELLEGQDGVQVVGDRFVFSSEVLFELAQADLSDAGKAEIAKVARILQGISGQVPEGIDWVIRVDGHTDDQPLSGFGRYRDNWELSQARALSVVRYMSDELGIPPQRLAANGFGEYQPLNPADTPEARAQNRRIELKLTER